MAFPLHSYMQLSHSLKSSSPEEVATAAAPLPGGCQITMTPLSSQSPFWNWGLVWEAGKADLLPYHTVPGPLWRSSSLLRRFHPMPWSSCNYRFQSLQTPMSRRQESNTPPLLTHTPRPLDCHKHLPLYRQQTKVGPEQVLKAPCVFQKVQDSAGQGGPLSTQPWPAGAPRTHPVLGASPPRGRWRVGDRRG